MPINDFKVLTRFSEITFLYLIFRYIFPVTFTSNKVFGLSQFNLFIACHLSKRYLQSERKVWFDLTQNFRFFISRIFALLSRKTNCFLKITVPEFQKYKTGITYDFSKISEK